jgi:hypothetical protein
VHIFTAKYLNVWPYPVRNNNNTYLVEKISLKFFNVPKGIKRSRERKDNISDERYQDDLNMK